ncbi:hypothetical protein BJ138DRAFT_1118520 [Hygrophoropsis aurantiaca]|uniref:Uncharacterized protein n=1 Tax=Hygrophoropsis aurantiaca TaxID=72124 RepID=A0ACB7ZWW2_9AGAM|nr:hypothetical protein BJ138DRAFT_1118520 [Hygrophoropsis aurantiaca]
MTTGDIERDARNADLAQMQTRAHAHVDFNVLPAGELKMYMFGVQAGSTQPIPPPSNPADWNVYTDTLISTLPPPKITELIPPPCEPAKGEWEYPQAPSFTLEEDARFRRGFVYAHDYHSSSAATHKDRLVRICTPPELTHVEFINHQAHVQPVPGMLEMEAGIPYVAFVNGDKRKAVTVGCVQTLHSLDQYAEGAPVRNLAQILQALSWGTSTRGNSEEKIIPVYATPGLLRNDRSSEPRSGSYEGSYNLASTVMKGNGRGILRPALQVSTPEAKSQFTDILTTLHKLYQLIVPLSISKEEWDVFEHVMKDNNVFSFGGLDPGPVGCQLNISECRSGGELIAAIGNVQGSWHVDIGDEPVTFTMVTMLLRIPPGSDPGAFALGRFGLYIRSLDTLVVFLIFKGNDVHSGFAPRESVGTNRQYTGFDSKDQPKQLDAVVEAWNLAGPVNRIVYVSYIQSGAFKRNIEIAFMPTVGFGNQAAMPPSTKDASYLTFLEHGRSTLGPSFEARVDLEFTMLQWNARIAGNIQPADSGSTITSKYMGREGVLVQTQVPFNPIIQATEVRNKRGRYTWLHSVILEYSIMTTKYEIKRFRTSQAGEDALREFPQSRPRICLGWLL